MISWKMGEEFIRLFFDIDEEDNIMIYVKGTKYSPCNIKAILSPEYETYEQIKRLIMLYNENCGGSAVASSQSNNYDNLLLLLAALTEKIKDSQLKEWETRFSVKFKIEESI